jgi:hypothetical protein
MSEALPETLLRANDRPPRRCPVCKKTTYSREASIHNAPSANSIVPG